MENKTNTPQELQPAYERPIDLASIDARMAEQIAFEGHGRTSPREQAAVENRSKEPEALTAKRTNKAKRALAVGSAIVAGAVGTHFVGKAIDHEIKSGEPPAYLKSKADSRGMVTFTPPSEAEK